MTPWEILGIEPTPDERAIKRAYAQKLKHTRPEDDKEGFVLLREAYERALEQRYWIRDEPDPDETPEPESELEPAPEPEPSRARRPIDAPPIQPDSVMPVFTRKDFRHGWRTAARFSEDALIRRITEDLEHPALMHLETRVEYECELLIWLLNHKMVWPRVSQMAHETLQWREKQTWPEWPWSQLESYHLRCRLHAFFLNPVRYWKDYPALIDWMEKNPYLDFPEDGRPKASYLRKRDDLKRELALFRSNYKDVLHYEPAGQARLDALEQLLNSFPLENAFAGLITLIMGIWLMYLCQDDRDDHVDLIIGSLFLFGFSIYQFILLARRFWFPTLLRWVKGVALPLARRTLSAFRALVRPNRDFLVSGFQQIQLRLMTPPAWKVILALASAGLATGVFYALLRWRAPDLAQGVYDGLQVSGALWMLTAGMLWNRASDWLANPPQRAQRWLELSNRATIGLGLTGVGVPLLLFITGLPGVGGPYGHVLNAVLTAVIVTATLGLLATRLHRHLGPGVPRRFLAYLALTLTDAVLLILQIVNRGNGEFGFLLLLFFLLMIPLLIRAQSAGFRGGASLVLLGLFVVHQLIYGAVAWMHLQAGHLTGLAGLLLVIYIPWYALTHDPKRD